jgi:hypothetical protein
MERRNLVVRKTRLRDQGREHDLDRTTPAERIGMMWQLALDAWAMMGQPVVEPRLPRHVVRIVQGRQQGATRTNDVVSAPDW